MPENTNIRIRPLVKAKKQFYSAQIEKDRNTIGKKICDARHAARYSLSAMAKALEVYGVSISGGGIYKWEAGSSVPSAYQLLAICYALHIPDGLAYFTSAGKMTTSQLNEIGLQKLSEYCEDLIASGRYSAEELPEENEIEMRIFDLPASAGTGVYLDAESYQLERFPAGTVPKGVDFALRVSGDSMTPYFLPNQIVWVQRCSSLRPKEVGIFIVDGEGYIKQYSEQLPPEEDREAFTDSTGVVHTQPVLISYNKNYAPRRITPEMSFQIIGRVLH